MENRVSVQLVAEGGTTLGVFCALMRPQVGDFIACSDKDGVVYKGVIKEICHYAEDGVLKPLVLVGELMQMAPKE